MRTIETNLGLLVFSILMIAAGFYVDFTPLVLLGFLMLIPSFRSSRQKDGPVPTSRPLPPRRAEPMRQHAPPRPPEPTMPTVSLPASRPASQAPTFSQALFPTTMFPSSPISSAPQPKAAVQEESKGKDELLEVGAMLAFYKLVFG